MIRVNCIYYGDFCHCNHPKMKKVLWLFKRECIELHSMDKCSLKVIYPKPDINDPLPRKEGAPYYKMKPDWIDVREKLPEIERGKRVLLAILYEFADGTPPEYSICIGLYSAKKNWLDSAGQILETPTHWADLPDPPEIEIK